MFEEILENMVEKSPKLSKVAAEVAKIIAKGAENKDKNASEGTAG